MLSIIIKSWKQWFGLPDYPPWLHVRNIIFPIWSPESPKTLSTIWTTHYNNTFTYVLPFVYRHWTQSSLPPFLVYLLQFPLFPSPSHNLGTFAHGRASCRSFRQDLESVTTGNKFCEDQEVSFEKKGLSLVFTAPKEMNIEMVAWKVWWFRRDIFLALAQVRVTQVRLTWSVEVNIHGNRGFHIKC